MDVKKKNVYSTFIEILRFTKNTNNARRGAEIS